MNLFYVDYFIPKLRAYCIDLLGHKKFGDFPKKGYADIPPLPLSFDPVFMDDAQCAESNKN